MAIAAMPILASALWTSHVKTRDNSRADRPHKRPRLSTGLCELDTALDGGLDYGHTTCVTAEADSDAQDLTLHLVAAHLLSHEGASATVIYSTLSFDVVKLHTHLAASCRNEVEGQDAAAEAVAMLDRVKIIKVFDFVGLTEGVAEIRADFEGERDAPAGPPPPPQKIVIPKGTIGDSEDEGEDEMLDDAPSADDRPNLPKMPPPSGPNDPRHLLVIDNIAHLASPLLKNNRSQGQALLTSFMRSLSHLTRTYDLCTVVLNNAISYRQSSREETPSIFSSCTLRPALGKAFASLLDLHLLVHRVPKTAGDARMIFGGGGGGGQRTDRAPEMVSVVEVLQDRAGGRVGRWAAVVGNETGGLRDAIT